MNMASSLDNFFQRLNDQPLAETIRSSALAFPWLESVHVLSIAMVLGTIVVVDLRLLGLASMHRPATGLIRNVLPVTWIAFAVALVTGTAMFLSNAVQYIHNGPFLAKMCMLVLAGINMLVFHLVTYRGVGGWDESARTPAGARAAGAISISVWLAIVAFGRWIGFTVGF
jgi:hypothetical protein